jgi:transcription elongation factor Elf1
METNKKVHNCPKCNGKTYYRTILKDRAGKQNHSCGISAIVPCDFPSCKNGKILK